MFDLHDILRKRALALLLLVNGGIAFLAIRPVAAFIEDLRQDPSVTSWNPRPPIVAFTDAAIEPNGETQAGPLHVALTMDPAAPAAGERTTFTWRVTDRRGRAVALDRTMHDKAMHAYAVREDLGTEVLHMHPPQQDDGAEWKDQVIFPTSGRWSLTMQAPAAGTLYQFASVIDVSGPEVTAATPDDARERAMFQFEVALDAPGKIVEGESARFHFTVRHVNETSPREVVEHARMHQNLIFAHAGDGRVWNQHGDGSVDMVSAKTPVKVVPHFKPVDPYAYDVTFPSVGTWLVDFEYLGEAAPFMIRVEPRQ